MDDFWSAKSLCIPCALLSLGILRGVGVFLGCIGSVALFLGRHSRVRRSDEWQLGLWRVNHWIRQVGIDLRSGVCEAFEDLGTQRSLDDWLFDDGELVHLSVERSQRFCLKRWSQLRRWRGRLSPPATLSLSSFLWRGHVELIAHVLWIRRNKLVKWDYAGPIVSVMRHVSLSSAYAGAMTFKNCNIFVKFFYP